MYRAALLRPVSRFAPRTQRQNSPREHFEVDVGLGFMQATGSGHVKTIEISRDLVAFSQTDRSWPTQGFASGHGSRSLGGCHRASRRQHHHLAGRRKSAFRPSPASRNDSCVAFKGLLKVLKGFEMSRGSLPRKPLCLGMLNDSTWSDFVQKLSGILQK